MMQNSHMPVDVIHSGVIMRAVLPRLDGLSFPFLGKKVGVTTDAEHYRGIDLSKEVLIPVSKHPGAFGFVRKYHTHEGVDLYCPEGEPVFAVEGGKVVAILDFTGPRAGSPWWYDTRALFIEGANGVVNYGEIEPRPALKVGDLVETGDIVGNVKTVLRKDNGRPRSMLHFELYVPGTRQAACWKVGMPKPQGLLDPTDLLVRAAGLITNG